MSVAASATTCEVELDLQAASAAGGLPSHTDFRVWAGSALSGRRDRALLTVRIVDEDESRQLNQEYRGQDKPTNVLSFPFDLPPGVPVDDDLADFIGDLAICAPVVEREASEQGKAPSAHWAHMTIHGVLHLLHYDHMTDEQAAEMEGLETAILQGLGFPPPYEERSPAL